jgi:hypothetical protein
MKSLFRTLLIFIVFIKINIINAQPGTEKEEFNRKKHWVGGTYGHPYTMFDRHNGKSFEQTVFDLRVRIQNEFDTTGNIGPIYHAYQLVYDNAMRTMPLDNGMPESGPSDLALWAKNNAFIMLVGLNRTADTLLDLHQRQLLKDKVITAFNNMSKDIPNKDGKYYTYFAGLGLTAAHPVLGGLVVSAALTQQVYEETNVKNLFKFYSRSHILWLQAYDLLKASAALPELESIKYFDNDNSDANQGRQSPRNKLYQMDL